MTDLQINKSLPFDKSYQAVIEDLHKWNKKMILQLEKMYDNTLIDMSSTFDDIHYFASFTNALLIEQENQLEKATSNEEIDIIQERINQIISEIELLQTLSFRLNYDSVKLTGKFQINYNNKEIKSDCSLFASLPYHSNTSRTISNSSELSTNNNYRFLISRNDAIELEKHFLPIFHLTSYDNQSINECVLTFNVIDLALLPDAFNSYWNLFPNTNEIRMLIPQFNISFVMGKLGERARLLAERFQLDQIKIFTNSCPNSNERILLINGKRRDLITDCIKEIYFNVKEQNNNEFIDQTIQFYNPADLSIDDISKIMITTEDYGGFIKNQTRSLTVNHSQSHITEDEESSDDDDDDSWDENDDWWNFQTNNSETIQREMIISNIYAGVIIGVNATRIDRIKQKTGAYVYINGETTDAKRAVIMKGTLGQVERAYTYVENLIERYKKGKLPIKQRHLQGKRKGK